MNEQNYNINIEKSVLSSIIFEPSQFDELSSLLKKDDFYLPAHQDIYAAIHFLTAQDKPIDEEFIAKELRRAKKFDETAMLDILSANPVAPLNIFSYVKEIRTDSINRQIYQLSLDLQHKFNLKTIDKLYELKEELESVDGLKQKKSVDSFLDYLSTVNLDFEEIENLKFSYLYDNFIVGNEITMIAAPPSSGKSLTAFALALNSARSGRVKHVVYLDADNSKTTIQKRNIHKIVQENRQYITYQITHKRDEIDKTINEAVARDLTGFLFVFDSIKNFFDGLDRDKNRDVSKVMNKLKALRDRGATILFLHHTNKPRKDVEDMYAGSSAFLEDTSNAFILKLNQNKKTFIFKCIKARTGDIEDQAFTYDSTNHVLSKIEVAEAELTKEDEEMIEETIQYLKSSRNKPMWSELWKNLTDLGYDKEKASKVIKSNEGKLWNFERGGRNNQKLYSLIETSTSAKSKVVETVYEYLAPRTPISPRTPDLGLYKESAIASDNSENPKILNNLSVVEKSVENFPREKIEMPTL
ncbi:DnaB-like helicase N-terminal domain-containing protein [Sulfurimonas sp.]|uniref:DnaB-like helicase N-terminal domain-containing protein n=1 Tax=Sulfurimonas sp. TaxID=2022749 RepID=UPI0019FFA9EC|nr:DnaB-like helicase N-terminal domain-containing protein [Sulfurimonas sp.]MBE0515469.1 AAA family ATPase [Sulfurimonas sp.]